MFIQLEAIVVGYLSALGVKDKEASQLPSSVKDKWAKEPWQQAPYSVATQPSLFCLQTNLLAVIPNLPWFALMVEQIWKTDFMSNW